jgi:small subunit ribosomal protein S17e
VKRSARVIVEKYYPKLTLDFDTNKRVTDEAAVVPSKRMRNKIAGFVTHLMRRIDRGQDVRGISLKLQEEERERKLDYVPEKSALQPDELTVDKETFDMLKSLGVDTTAGVHKVDPQRQGGHRGERTPRAA